jgi:N4-gp56 family major capsid protein
MADALMGVTETSAAAVDVIGSQVQTYLQQASKILGQVTDYSSLVVKGAKSVEIPRSGGFTVGSKSENTAVDAQIITYATDAIALDQHKVIQWLLEDIANEQTVVSVLQDALMKAGKDMAREVDQNLINILETASASAPDHRIAYAGTSVIAEADILDARQLMIAQNLDPSELVLAVNPAQEKVMLGLSNFIDASKYGTGASPIATGEIGRVFGATVIVHNDVESLKSLLFHKSSVGYASQLAMRFKSESDLANLATRYSLDHLYGSKLLDSGKRCVMIGTAA